MFFVRANLNFLKDFRPSQSLFLKLFPNLATFLKYRIYEQNLMFSSGVYKSLKKIGILDTKFLTRNFLLLLLGCNAH